MKFLSKFSLTSFWLTTMAEMTVPIKQKPRTKSRLFERNKDYSPGIEHSKLALSTEQRAFFNTDIIPAS